MKRSDPKEPMPLFSFILRKNAAKEKREPGTDMLDMHEDDEDTAEVEKRKIPEDAKILRKALWSLGPENRLFRKILMTRFLLI